MDSAAVSDKVVINGLVTPDTIEAISKPKVNAALYYSINCKHGLTGWIYDKLIDLDSEYPILAADCTY